MLNLREPYIETYSDDWESLYNLISRCISNYEFFTININRPKDFQSELLGSTLTLKYNNVLMLVNSRNNELRIRKNIGNSNPNRFDIYNARDLMLSCENDIVQIKWKYIFMCDIDDDCVKNYSNLNMSYINIKTCL